MITTSRVVLTIAMVLAGVYVLRLMYGSTMLERPRDDHGCLLADGYTFDPEVGACTRGTELTPDIAAAARLAVDKVGSGYALTVVSFNSYEDRTYDIILERGRERTRQVLRIMHGVAIEQ